MEREPDARPSLVVRRIGRIGFRSTPVDFFIDGQPAGALKGVSARYLPIGVGVHRVSARVGFFRSRGLVLSLASGELVSLECGFHRYRILRTATPAALMLGSLLFLYQVLKDPIPMNRRNALQVLAALGPQASKAVPAILPLLDEPFEPVTPFERDYPEIADPAASAAWALGAIAPGTNMAETSRARLKDFLARSGNGFKRGNATWALRQLDPNIIGEK